MKEIQAVEVANSIFGPGLFSLKNGRALYDEVWMADGGNALYLVRLNNDLSIQRRWIPWNTVLLQHYDPME